MIELSPYVDEPGYCAALVDSAEAIVAKVAAKDAIVPRKK